MAENQRDFKGVWIPKAVWLDSRLNLKDKYYLSLYQQYGVERTVDRLMEYVATKGTIAVIKKKLRNLQLLENITDYNQAKQLVLERKGLGEECEWCGYKTTAIQEHHYPIPKYKGGAETVRICPNCHYEYHALLKDEE